MFQKIAKTAYPPPVTTMVWDGECGFCKFWITRWKQITGPQIKYRPYQDIAQDFKDIPLKEFKKASRLIETDGSIYSGPDSAYRCYDYALGNYPFHKWYQQNLFFQRLSDHGYNWIAKHRSFMYKLTHLCFGKNPLSLKPYWLVYTFIVILLIYIGIHLF